MAQATLVFGFGLVGALRAEESSFRILLTNDDGIDSAGLLALAAELEKRYEVMLAAQIENQSGTGSTSALRPSLSNEDGDEVPTLSIMKIERRSLTDTSDGLAVDGTPADSVRVGLRCFSKNQPVDMVFSGINLGENLGARIRGSGTIGAAFTARSMGVPSIAVSASRNMTNFTVAARFTAKVVRKVRECGLAENVMLSINIPSGELEGVISTPMALTDQRRGRSAEFRETESGDLIYQVPNRRGRRGQGRGGTGAGGAGGRPPRTVEPADTDEYFYRVKRHIAITPLHLDWTDHKSISELNSWELGL